MMKQYTPLLVVLILAPLTACYGMVDEPAQGDASGEEGSTEGPDAGPSEPEEGEEPPIPLALVKETRGGGLELRGEPNNDSDVLAYMPDYAAVEITGEKSGKWWPLRYKNKEGWAHQSKVSIHMDGDVPSAPKGFNFHLPWKDGKSHTTTGDHSSHNNPLTHWAWDFSMPIGTPLHASHSGVVRKVKKNSSRGGCSSAYLFDANYVIIDRGDGLETNYVHLKNVSVKVGDNVKRGDLIGKSGQTGYSCGPHLHFHIQKSPDWGGSTTAQSNQSVHVYFWDKGWRFDPKYPKVVTARGTSSGIP